MKDESDSHRGSSFFPFSSKFSLRWDWEWVGVDSISSCNCGSLLSWQLKSGGLGQAHQLVGCDQMQKKGQKKKREKEKVRTQWTVKEGQA